MMDPAVGLHCSYHHTQKPIMIDDRIDWDKGNALIPYSEGACSESQPRHRLPVFRFFVVFLSPFRQILG
jgi:hypothetical protein